MLSSARTPSQSPCLSSAVSAGSCRRSAKLGDDREVGINPSLDGNGPLTFGDMPRSWLRAESRRMVDNRVSLLGRDMAIDLGTANTRVCVRGQGIILNEPAVVAVNIKDGTRSRPRSA